MDLLTKILGILALLMIILAAAFGVYQYDVASTCTKTETVTTQTLVSGTLINETLRTTTTTYTQTVMTTGTLIGIRGC